LGTFEYRWCRGAGGARGSLGARACRGAPARRDGSRNRCFPWSRRIHYSM